jgi:hypothetical protein
MMVPRRIGWRFAAAMGNSDIQKQRIVRKGPALGFMLVRSIRAQRSAREANGSAACCSLPETRRARELSSILCQGIGWHLRPNKLFRFAS